MIDTNVKSIVHPTDFSRASLNALAHALRIAVAAQGRLNLVHIQSDAEEEWGRFPRVRVLLGAWGMIAPDAARSALAKELGLDVRKSVVKLTAPARGVEAFVGWHPCDLMVLMTHARSSWRHWLNGSVAEDTARRAGTPTLFLREYQKGFVDSETGVVSLGTILLPIGDGAGAEQAWLWTTGFKQLLAPNSRIYLLHVGSSAPSHVGGVEGPIDVRLGPAVETIVRVAKEIDADMIVMPTAGREGLLDALRRSLMERVLRESPCPVLAIPTACTGGRND